MAGRTDSDLVEGGAPPPFWIKPLGDDGLTFTVHGELDLASADTLELLPLPTLAPGTVVVLDLANLELVDSTGLRALLVLRRRVIDAAAHLVLRQLPPRVLRVVQIAGVEQIFTIESD